MGDRPHDASGERVFSRYVGPVYPFIYSWVGNREDAEDLTSETFPRIDRETDDRSLLILLSHRDHCLLQRRLEGRGLSAEQTCSPASGTSQTVRSLRH